MATRPITADAGGRARSNSVKQLCDLYRVVIAIAVGIACHDLVSEYAEGTLRIEEVLLFFVLMILVIPFFHGAVRHLFATYVEDGESSQIKHWAILIDYYLLFAEGGVFVALASTFDSYETFVILLVAILALDTVWGLLAHLGFTGNASQKAEMKWAWINFVTAAVILIIYFLHSYLGLSEFHFIALLTIAMVVRTVVDYTLNIQFYCP